MLRKKDLKLVPLYIIAGYFLLDGFGVLLGTITNIAFSFEQLYRFLDNFRFLYVQLPGIQSNDPFIAAVIQTVGI